MLKLIIVGAGGFGREVLWLAREINRHRSCYEILGFLDDNPARSGQIDGVPVLGGTEDAAKWTVQPDVRLVIGIGEPDIKRAIVERLAPYNPVYTTLIDPTVRGDWDRIRIGEGSVICAGTILTTNITVGRHVILNLMVNVGHDAVIGDWATVAPNATISGNVRVGEGDYLGSGSIIRDEVEVGPWTIVGMGAVVTKSMPGGMVVAGLPAQVIRENTARRVW